VDRDLSAVARVGPPWDDGAEGVRPTIRTTELPTLDAHVDPARAPEELRRSGAVLAMTLSLSLDEAAAVVDRPAPLVAWGVGCHPRRSKAQAAFDASRFASSRRGRRSSGRSGSTRDGRAFPSRTSCGFRQALDFVGRLPRFTSIHSYSATALLLEELRQRPIAAPVLHGWTSTAAETREAVALGCTFSIHSAVARESKFRTAVPPERILVETDHGWADPPAAIPCRIEWVEHLVAQQLSSSVEDVRGLVWGNLARIIRDTGTEHLLPPALRTLLRAGSDGQERSGPGRAS